MESSVIHDQEVAVAYQPRNKPFHSHTMANEQNTQSYNHAWNSRSQRHMSLNYDQRNVSSYELSNAAPRSKQISRSQHMYDQSWNVPSSGGITSYATVFLEHNTDRDNYKRMRENWYHNDQSRSSPSARGVSAYGYGTSSSDHKMVNVKQKSKSQYMYDHSRSSPSVGGISRYATPLAECKVGGSKQNNKSQTDQFRSSPSSGGKYGSTTSHSGREMKKQKNKDSCDQSWNLYIVEGISSMLSWLEPTESKQKASMITPGVYLL